MRQCLTCGAVSSDIECSCGGHTIGFSWTVPIYHDWQPDLPLPFPPPQQMQTPQRKEVV
jgi:hypothetical protein